MRRHIATVLAALAAVPPPATAGGPGVKVPCLLTPADSPVADDASTRTGVVTGGPWTASGPVIGITITCTFRHSADPFGPEAAPPAEFTTVGLVGVLPPMPVTVPVNPATGSLYLCTTITYIAFTPFDVYNACALVPDD